MAGRDAAVLGVIRVAARWRSRAQCGLRRALPGVVVEVCELCRTNGQGSQSPEISENFSIFLGISQNFSISIEISQFVSKSLNNFENFRILKNLSEILTILKNVTNIILGTI